jgi:hypothetical protein
MKMRTLWDVAPCSLVGLDRRFRGAYCLHHQVYDSMHTLETSLYTSETTPRCIPEGSRLQIKPTLVRNRLWASRLEKGIGKLFWVTSVNGDFQIQAVTVNELATGRGVDFKFKTLPRMN